METLGAIANSLWQVTLIGLLLGAGLPIVFALGIRALDGPEVSGNGPATARKLALTVAGYALVGIVILTVVIGILYVAKDFIYHTTSVSLFGAESKGK